MTESDIQDAMSRVEGAGDTRVMSESEKSPAEIYHEEWQNPMNWGGPGNKAVYFSKRDKRIWVPKYKSGKGWTLNIARTGGLLWLVGICVGMLLVLTLAVNWIFLDYLVVILN